VEIVMLARLFYGMARNSELPAVLGRINPRTRTPLRAIDRDECHYDGAILFQADAIAEGVRGWPR
jgi:hypothetical protein